MGIEDDTSFAAGVVVAGDVSRRDDVFLAWRLMHLGLDAAVVMGVAFNTVLRAVYVGVAVVMAMVMD